ncbi:hypothetical protein KUTeg_018769 [Tegillarca granosa]|uniref:Core-binding (CB) domain-containing protein n=1 Tax=Tegillarca granosa TaxID=220873 RepID=A0ABQ9EG84_TEGGR|nr:hypothetical protein KUTeg_018769 [Tegillarca granosa]
MEVRMQTNKVVEWTNFASFRKLLMRTRTQHLCRTGYGWSSVGAQTVNAVCLSINTKLDYQTALQQFTNFRRFLKLPDLWPVQIDHLLSYISYQSQKGLSPSTVSSYLAAISHVHKVYNWTNPKSQFLVQKAVTGLRRIRQVRDSRAPVTEDMLHNIYHILETVCWSEYELWLFRSAYCLAFYGLLRVSELVYTTADMAHRPLFYSDIKVSTSESQFAQCLVLRNFCQFETGLMPVNTLSVQCCTIKLGLPVSVFSSHSFRIGAATTLALKGLDPSIIQSLRRWSSDAFPKYIRLDKLHNYLVSMFGYWAHLLYIGHAEWQIDSYRDIYVWTFRLSHKLTYLPPPKVLILHVGANNTPSTSTGILCNRIKQDIHQLAIWMPDCFVIWSDLICRPNWRREISIQTLERKRKRINRMGRGVSIIVGGSFIKHPDITFDCPGLFRPDQVHLSDIGNAIFLNDLQYCLDQLLCQSPAKVDPRGRNLAIDVSWEVQGQNVSYIPDLIWTIINYFVKALLRLDPRGRNLAMDISWEVQGHHLCDQMDVFVAMNVADIEETSEDIDK